MLWIINDDCFGEQQNVRLVLGNIMAHFYFWCEIQINKKFSNQSNEVAFVTIYNSASLKAWEGSISSNNANKQKDRDYLIMIINKKIVIKRKHLSINYKWLGMLWKLIFYHLTCHLTLFLYFSPHFILNKQGSVIIFKMAAGCSDQIKVNC